MNAQGDSRVELAAQVRTLNVAFEETALRTLLPPLLDVDLTVQQMKVLTVLVTSDGDTTGAKLATMFGVSMASMSKLLDRLEARGMARRTEDEFDARAKRIAATELGKAAMRSLVVSRPEFGDDILLQLEVEDLRALVRGMKAVAEVLAARHRV